MPLGRSCICKLSTQYTQNPGKLPHRLALVCAWGNPTHRPMQGSGVISPDGATGQTLGPLLVKPLARRSWCDLCFVRLREGNCSEAPRQATVISVSTTAPPCFKDAWISNRGVLTQPLHPCTWAKVVKTARNNRDAKFGTCPGHLQSHMNCTGNRQISKQKITGLVLGSLNESKIALGQAESPCSTYFRAA